MQKETFDPNGANVSVKIACDYMPRLLSQNLNVVVRHLDKTSLNLERQRLIVLIDNFYQPFVQRRDYGSMVVQYLKLAIGALQLHTLHLIFVKSVFGGYDIQFHCLDV